jgi:UDP-N-acetyl-D-glucosamine dehydrogenase
MAIGFDRIRKKEINVGVIGLGYVGLPLSLTFAEAGFCVFGFDNDREKVELINNGSCHLKHIDSSKLQDLTVTCDFTQVAECEALIICVPTPLNDHLEPDLKFIEETCSSIAPHLSSHTLVSLESTTWPGTTEEVVLPILEAEGTLKLGTDLYLAYSPEREDPGNQNYKTKSIPKLIGAADKKSSDFAMELYSQAFLEVILVDSMRVAEAAKLFENVFRSVNIALVNEFKIVLDKMGIDVWGVIKAAETKPFGFMPFWPGPGLGGHCIPIDPFYLTWKAKEFGISTRLIEIAGEVNRSMPKWVVGKVQDCLNHFSKSLKGSRILVLGLAYKSDVEDVRESPSLELIKQMEDKGAHVDYYDPIVIEVPKTRRYMHLKGRKSAPPSKKYDCFVLATDHSIFSAEEFLSYEVPIVDTRNFFPRHKLVFAA